MNPESRAFITRTAIFLPNAPVANDDIEAILGCIGGKPSRARRMVLRSNGIRQRHYAIDPATGEATHSNAQLTAEAVRGLTGNGFDLSAIDCLACGTARPDQLMPGHGVMVHGELGNPPCEVVTTAGICVSGIAALKYAWMAVRAGLAANAVATGSELPSPSLHARHFAAESARRLADLESHPEIAFEKDFLRWMLSDGAGAFLVQPQPAPDGQSLAIDWIDILSQANHMPVCMYAGGELAADGSLTGWQRFSPEEWGNRSLFAIRQEVRLLNEAVVRETFVRPLRIAVARHGLRAADVDWLLPHMSSEYFRPQIIDCMAAEGFAVPQERWFTNLATRGNTGAASMYIMLDELLKSGRLRAGQRLLCCIPESGRFTGALMHLTVVGDA
ncbi:MAG: StlD/DarB family beta-ketosynthase [Betaproteobacteria bacterium]|nr:StlD/DarB family beta-ketosynthase [Betaproteobacteria bacterium]